MVNASAQYYYTTQCIFLISKQRTHSANKGDEPDASQGISNEVRLAGAVKGSAGAIAGVVVR